MNNTAEYDVIVVGAGISGSMAAIAAARDGARTLLIEQHAFAGGMLTAAGVGPMMTFHAGKEQVVRGITDELVQRLVARGKSPGHIFDSTGYTYTVTPFDSEAMKQELDNMFIDAGVNVLLHTQLAKVTVANGAVTGITVCNKAGLSTYQGKVYIDATGDADLSAWAGVPCLVGRPEDGKCQPQTMKFRMINVDIAETKDYIRKHPEDFPSLKGDTSLIDKSPRLSIGGFRSLVEQARQRGEFDLPRPSVLMFETNNPNEVIINTSRILDHDPTDPACLSRAEMIGRRQVRQLEEFLIKWIPGFANAVLVCSGPNIGTRSSRNIQGLYTLTGDDIAAFRKFDDAVAYSGYPVDVHPPEGGEMKDFQEHFRNGEYYSIPYRCLVNDCIDNIVTVGRCVSATFEAQAALRTTPTVGAIGHAGGVAASMAARQAIPAQHISAVALRHKLREQGAFLL